MAALRGEFTTATPGEGVVVRTRKTGDRFLGRGQRLWSRLPGPGDPHAVRRRSDADGKSYTRSEAGRAT